METATETPAPAPATDPAPPPPAAPAAEESRSPLARMNAEERQAWDLHGTRPEWLTIDGAPAAAAKDAPKATEPPATGDDAPAVDARGQQIRGADGKFVSNKERRQQEQNERVRLAVENGTAEALRLRDAAEQRARDLESRLTALERGTTPPKPAEPAAQPADGKPKWGDFEAQIGPKFKTWGEAQEAYQDARDEWKDVQARTSTAQSETQRTVNETITAHQAREVAFAKTVPDYPAKTQALRLELEKGLQAGAPLVLPLLESPRSAEILNHFADHPEEMERIGRLGLSNPPAALRELGRLEERFEAAAKADPPAPVPPPKKTLSAAPPPPTQLGTRPAEPADASRAAVASGNFHDYDAEMTRRDLARSGRR